MARGSGRCGRSNWRRGDLRRVARLDMAAGRGRVVELAVLNCTVKMAARRGRAIELATVGRAFEMAAQRVAVNYAAKPVIRQVVEMVAGKAGGTDSGPGCRLFVVCS